MESFEDWNRRIEITFNKLENTESVFDVAKEEIISLGFEFYAFGVKYSTPFAVPRVEMYSNYPSDWLSQYIEDSYVLIDPTVKHGMSTVNTFNWHDLKSGSKEFWCEAAQAGLVHGLAKPIHMPNHLFSMLSISRSAEPVLEYEMGAVKAKVNALALHLAEKIRSFREVLSITQLPILSSREREILMWSADGKTSEEIGIILGVTSNTITFIRRTFIKN